MIVRSKAPLRVGFAGGGTDVSPYSDMYGGAILNASINMYAYASIEPRKDGRIILHAVDKNVKLKFESTEKLPLDGNLDLLKAIYNRIAGNWGNKKLSFEFITFVDAPPGSGLDSSSTLVIAIIKAFAEWLKLSLTDYEIANLAYIIERKDLNYAGGKQDQYAATFRGFNFMEFYSNDKVIVNPLRIRNNILNELANNIILYYTGTSRLSSEIIEKQQVSVKQNSPKSVEAMHQTKEMAVVMKEAILKGKLDDIGPIMMQAWEYKKKMAEGISNEKIDEIYEAAIKAGASGGKISGAGGGGFMFYYCPGNHRYNVINTLEKFGEVIKLFQFTKNGLNTWAI